MTTDWVSDIHYMHVHYGFHEKVAKLSQKELLELLQFRLRFLAEELKETNDTAALQQMDEVVDGLIDLCVVAIGTLNLFQVNAYEAWDRVHKANMSKEVGIKASRPNPLGLPDLVKPEGWEPPFHHDNLGLLDMDSQSMDNDDQWLIHTCRSLDS